MPSPAVMKFTVFFFYGQAKVMVFELNAYCGWNIFCFMNNNDAKCLFGGTSDLFGVFLKTKGILYLFFLLLFSSFTQNLHVLVFRM